MQINHVFRVKADLSKASGHNDLPQRAGHSSWAPLYS